MQTCPAPPHPHRHRRRRGRYLALRTRDARFDGQFFTGVTSTGIYCRPVCAVRTPRRENCCFALAAQAERRFPALPALPPEVAPQALAWSVQDATTILVQQAVRLLDASDAWGDGQGTTAGPAGAAPGRERPAPAPHLRGGIGHLAPAIPQTRRLLTGKQLLTDTAMPVTQVALASGFGSVRCRFNAAFAQHYGLNGCTRLRSAGTAPGTAHRGSVRLAYRPPFDAAALLAFCTAPVRGVEGAGRRCPDPCAAPCACPAPNASPAGWQRGLTRSATCAAGHVESLHPCCPR